MVSHRSSGNFTGHTACPHIRNVCMSGGFDSEEKPFLKMWWVQTCHISSRHTAGTTPVTGSVVVAGTYQEELQYYPQPREGSSVPSLNGWNRQREGEALPFPGGEEGCSGSRAFRCVCFTQVFEHLYLWRKGTKRKHANKIFSNGKWTWKQNLKAPAFKFTVKSALDLYVNVNAIT